MKRGAGRVATALLVLMTVISGVGVATAAFTAGSTADLPVSSATLQPATSVTATDSGCINALAPVTQVTVSWTASASSFVGGYTVTKSTAGGPSTPVGTTTAGTNTITDSAATLNSSIVYTVVATKGTGWTSTAASASAVTTRIICP